MLPHRSAAPESQRGRVPLVNPPAIEAKINASATVKKVGKDRLSPYVLIACM